MTRMTASSWGGLPARPVRQPVNAEISVTFSLDKVRPCNLFLLPGRWLRIASSNVSGVVKEVAYAKKKSSVFLMVKFRPKLSGKI